MRTISYIHRYLGWISGAIVAILCATGLVLLLQPEVERVAEPERFRLPANAQRDAAIDLDSALENFTRRETESFDDPTTIAVSRLYLPNSPKRPWRAIVEARNAKTSWTYLAYFDPHTGEGVAYGPSKTIDFFKTVRRLHTSLCIQPRNVGRQIVGWATVLFIFTLLTGLVRWFPRRWTKAATKAAFVSSFKHGAFRAIYDVHKVWGFYATAVLLLLALTGVWISFPGARDAFDKAIRYDKAAYVAPTFDVAPDKAGEAGEAGEATLQAILDGQNAKTPGVDYDVFFNPKAATVVFSRNGGFCVPTRYYWNRRTGDFLGEEAYGDLPFGHKIRRVIMPIHKGVFWGDVTRVIFALGCLVGVIAAVTGYWLTLKRWDREEKSAKRSVVENNNFDDSKDKAPSEKDVWE